MKTRFKTLMTLLSTTVLATGLLAGCGSTNEAADQKAADPSETNKVKQEQQINVHHIRNATEVVNYAGKKFLIDPMLAEKGVYDPFPNAKRDDRNPLVDLPESVTVDDIISNVDAVIVTHTHYDHFDDAAKKILPKDIKLFMQDEADANSAKEAGFTNVEILQQSTDFEGVQLIKTDGHHGRGDMIELAGSVMGVIFKHPDQKTLYVAGDTVWYDKIQETLDTYKPDIIILNGGDNQFLEGGSLIMGKDDIYEVYKAAPDAKIIVVHMEAVNHWNLSRAELKSFIKEKGMTNVVVPDDGEEYSL